MDASLSQRLKDRTDDIEGWHMLARSYNALERYLDASAAYAHLLTQTPNDPDLLADYADTLAMVKNQNLQGAPEALINRALKAIPTISRRWRYPAAQRSSGATILLRSSAGKKFSNWRRRIRKSPYRRPAAWTRRAACSLRRRRRRMRPNQQNKA